jgi:hypothetical protein
MKRRITDPAELRELNQTLAQALALYLKQFHFGTKSCSPFGKIPNSRGTSPRYNHHPRDRNVRHEH